MSFIGGVVNYAYRWWYSAEEASSERFRRVRTSSEEFSSLWRTVHWEKSDIEREVKDIVPSNSRIRNLRILLYGPVGAGKSSFINSLNSAFRGRISTKACVATSGATLCTKVYKGYQIKSSPTEALPITIFDFMGLEEKRQNFHPNDLRNALLGHLPDGYKLNPYIPLSSDDPRYISNPSNEEKTHCVVCVVSGNTISLMHEDTIRQMKTFLEEARQLGIPRAVIMTKVDEVCPVVKKDLKNIYRSKTIKNKMQECSVLFDIPMTCIFPVKNYHEESETESDTDVLLLLALTQIAHFARDYTENLLKTRKNRILRE